MPIQGKPLALYKQDINDVGCCSVEFTLFYEFVAERFLSNHFSIVSAFSISLVCLLHTQALSFSSTIQSILSDCHEHLWWRQFLVEPEFSYQHFSFLSSNQTNAKTFLVVFNSLFRFILWRQRYPAASFSNTSARLTPPSFAPRHVSTRTLLTTHPHPRTLLRGGPRCPGTSPSPI